MHPACELCKGACCEFFQLQPRTWGWPEDVTRWLELHGKVVGPAVQFGCACSKLKDGKCSIYESRPDVCVKYEVGGEHCRATVRERRPFLANEILKRMT